MILTHRGPRSQLPAVVIMLTALLCASCGSDSDPADEAAMPADGEMTQDGMRDCPLSIEGATVNIGPLNESSGLLNEFGGACQLAETVLASAAERHRTLLDDHYCSLAATTAAAIGAGNMGVALAQLEEWVAQGEYDEEEARPKRIALSICDDEMLMNAAVEEFFAGVELTVYSNGLAKHEDTFCPTAVWSFTDANQTQHFDVTGHEACAELALPHTTLFDPERNPDGQRPGDYIRGVLGYNGELPTHYEHKGNTYPFTSDEAVLALDGSQATPPEADRSLLGEDADQYVYWLTGDELVDNGVLSASQAVTRSYFSEDLKELPIPERILGSLHRSYGIPVISDVVPDENSNESIIRAKVTTASGNQFDFLVKPDSGMSMNELLDWLPEAHLELPVARRSTPDSDDSLILAGALFTDGETTFFGDLENCNCSTQGLLAVLSEEALESGKEVDKLHEDYIARERDTEVFRDWRFSSDYGPRSLNYVLSGYSASNRDKDAAYVVHNGNKTHSLLVAMDLTCGDELLLFRSGNTELISPASCTSVDSRGLVYTLSESPAELMNAIRAGSRMTIGLVKPGASAADEEFQFSLLGASRSMDAVAAEEQSFGDQVVSHYADTGLAQSAVTRLFDLLEKRPVYCRPGLTPPDCTPDSSVPSVSAAQPVLNAARPVVRDRPPEGFAPAYAQVIAEQIGASDRSECAAVADRILDIASSRGRSDSLAAQIDRVIATAPDSCF